MVDVVGIHQPNFLPWLGYFAKISKVDVFVMLDDAQPVLTAGSYLNRVPICRDGSSSWLTVPISRESKKTLDIRKMMPAKEDWFIEASRKIASFYGGHEYFKEVEELLNRAYFSAGGEFIEFNKKFVRYCSDALGLNHVRMVNSGDFGVSSKSTQRLIDICTALGSNRYLSGDGTDGYQDNDLMSRAGIEVKFLNFMHPQYSQKSLNGFVKGLSIVDCIANIGLKQSARLLKEI